MPDSDIEGVNVTSIIAKRRVLSHVDSPAPNVVPRRALPEYHIPPAPPRNHSHARQRRSTPVGSFLADPPKGRLRRLFRILLLEPKGLVLVFVGSVVASLVSLLQPVLAGMIVGELRTGTF